MSVFDPTLDAAPIKEANTDPILPEERFVFELVGFERSEPDQYRKNGGVKWTFLVFDEDGHPFEFKDAPYELWRNTDVNAQGKPLFNLGTQAHAWASALLGRTLGVDEHFAVSELRGKKMSAMVVWQPKRTKPGEKAATLAILRHVPVVTPVASNGTAPAAAPAPGQVSADPSDEDIDRALLVTKLQKSVARLTRLDTAAGNAASHAMIESDLDTAPLLDIQHLIGEVQVAIEKAMTD